MVKLGGPGLELPALDPLAPEAGLVIVFAEQVKEASHPPVVTLNGDKLPVWLDRCPERKILARQDLSQDRISRPVHELADRGGDTARKEVRSNPHEDSVLVSLHSIRESALFQIKNEQGLSVQLLSSNWQHPVFLPDGSKPVSHKAT